MIEDKDRFKAVNDLIDWFNARDMSPAEGVAVMVTLMAIQITSTTTDIKQLHRSAETVKALYLLDIAEQLRLGAI